MARRKTSKSDLPTPPDDEYMKLLIDATAESHAQKELVVALTSSEKLVTVRGTTSGREPNYRNETVMGGQEFLFQEARLGANGNLLFCFKPMDMQSYSGIEVAENKLFEIFPTAVDLFKPIIGFQGFADEVTPGPAFRRYVGRFRQLHIDFEAEKERKKLEAAEAARRSEARFYEDNPMFGAF